METSPLPTKLLFEFNLPFPTLLTNEHDLDIDFRAMHHTDKKPLNGIQFSRAFIYKKGIQRKRRVVWPLLDVMDA